MEEAIAIALRHHQAGQFAQAETLYRHVLDLHPNHPDALHLLGVLAGQTGRDELAVELIGRAIAGNPSAAEYRCNLGNALRGTGRLDEAIEAYRHAIRLNPAYPDAHNNLGTALREKGNTLDAIAASRRALELTPRSPDVHYNLAIALAAAGHLDDAIAAYRQALALRPDYPEASKNLGNACLEKGDPGQAIAVYQQALALRADPEIQCNLGNAYARNGDLAAAIAAYREALRMKPATPAFQHNLAIALVNEGNALKQAGRPVDAAAAYRQAIALRPDYPEAHYFLGVVLETDGLPDDAIAAYREALRQGGDHSGAHNNLGNLLAERGEFDAALESYGHALRIKEDYADAHWNRALLRLLLGDYQRGWPEYEWRMRLKGFVKGDRVIAQPLWDGADFKGQTLLLCAEQGFGDTLQFIRYAPMVASRGGRVMLSCQPELGRLFQGIAGADQIVTAGALPRFDIHCPLLSLPLLFGTELETIPRRVPYLKADPRLAESWKSKIMPSAGRPRVGLVWGGNPGQSNDRNRSAALARFAPLAKAGAIFYSLQKGPPAAQAADPPRGMELIDHSADLTDFAETAALISLLDLVITVDTAVAHLAGAMGKPTWVLLSHKPDWRWMIERADNPWYPTMRLFRQKRAGQWDDAIEQMAEALAEWKPE